MSRPGERPRPLAIVPAARRETARVDVVLPQVPVGMRRLRSGGSVVLVHYWAMWERHGRLQAAALDSLRREPGLADLEIVVVCFDPFPSVARFVGRNRLKVAVLLDGSHSLSRTLPCPSVPYTYLLDRSGRIAAAQPGEVDWFAPETMRTLGDLLAEPERGDGGAL